MVKFLLLFVTAVWVGGARDSAPQSHAGIHVHSTCASISSALVSKAAREWEARGGCMQEIVMGQAWR